MPEKDSLNHLVGETDAQIWARTWLETIAQNPAIPADEATMIGWFANAIMSGFDAGVKQEHERPLLEKIHELVFQVAGAATSPLLQDNPEYVFPSERVIENVNRILEEFGIPLDREAEWKT